MITIELDETPSGNKITVISGINSEIYDLNRVRKALKKITDCDKSKLTEDNNIILSGSHIKKCNEFVTRIGF